MRRPRGTDRLMMSVIFAAGRYWKEDTGEDPGGGEGIAASTGFHRAEMTMSVSCRPLSGGVGRLGEELLS
ncbi:hypothetical protein [Streptomyces sp. NPDC048411]|uniref:hypothetical protein n=1 Tax=Streptomyces sp. NPDC048411 TaxID=3157206 RepID=UPI003454BC6B